jgi:protein-disulfide isomerase-like protein with CxxC motif
MTATQPVTLIYAFDAFCGSCYEFGPGVREPADANSEVSSTRAGFIPPRSRITGVRFSAPPEPSPCRFGCFS